MALCGRSMSMGPDAVLVDVFVGVVVVAVKVDVDDVDVRIVIFVVIVCSECSVVGVVVSRRVTYVGVDLKHKRQG